VSSLSHKQALLADAIIEVGRGISHGVYVFGPPGTGKTYTVRTALEQAKIKYHYQQGHANPMPLFLALQEFPNRIHVLDDTAEILRNRPGLEILKAALGLQHDLKRVVTYQHRTDRMHVEFRGGIIAVSNEPSISTALRSRINCYYFDLTECEMDELMERIVSVTYKHPSGHVLTSDQCIVCLQEIRRIRDGIAGEGKHLRLDLRHLTHHAYSTYLSEQLGVATTPWRERLEAALRQEITSSRANTRAATIDDERQIVAGIMSKYPQRTDRGARLKEWKEQTGKSQAAMYRRLSELES
jgi:hypothetical protein